MARFRSELAAVTAAMCTGVSALALAGCGGVDVDIPDFEAPRDRMTVIVDGERTTIAQSGSAEVEISGVPELGHDGPLGCDGRYFTDSESDVYFRYGPRRAYLLRFDTLFRFGAPERAGGQLIWSDDFDGRKVTVLVNCPPP
jgi:hypothetical protein